MVDGGGASDGVVPLTDFSADSPGCSGGAVAPTLTAEGEAAGSANRFRAGVRLVEDRDVDGEDGAVARGLQLGSADPHMLQPVGAVTEPLAKPQAAFSLNQLDPAEPAELRQRELPRMNDAPATAWRAAPAPQLGEPPVVASLDDLLPQETQRQVRWWCKQVRRAIAAARRGNLSLAKRLRPADLVLRPEQHMVEGTEAWVWDLRPLAEGRPAVPLRPSGSAEPPSTDLDLAAVVAASRGFADQEVIAEMVHGYSDDSGCERVTVLSPPHVGGLRHFAAMREKLDSDVVKGWATAGWELPFWPIRAQACSVVDESRPATATKPAKIKFRVTTDESWPREEMGLGVQSVNGGMDRSAWPAVRMVRVRQLAESAAILQTAGVPVRLWSFDLSDYYRRTGRQRADLWHHCYMMDDGFVVDEREQFGDASAAVKCVRQSGFLAWCVRRAMAAVDAQYPPRDPAVAAWMAERPGVEEGSAVGFFGLYVDDGCGGSLDDELFTSDGSPLMRGGQHCRRAQLHFEAARAAVERFGHTSAPAKEQAPCEVLEVLGMELSLVDGRMRLMEEKRLKYAAIVEKVAAKKLCSHKQFSSLLHRLVFACSAFPQGRQLLHPCFRVAKARYRLQGDMVPITDRVRRALQQWVVELQAERPEGVPLAARYAFPAVGEAGVGVTYSDASGQHGFGAWTVRGVEVLYFCEEWTAAERDALHINVKELLATTAALVTFQPELDARYVVEFTDNTAAEGAAQRLSPTTAQMQQLVQRRVAFLRECGAFSSMARVGTRQNKWADLLSRSGGEAEFLRQVAALGLTARRCSVPAAWRSTVELLQGEAL